MSILIIDPASCQRLYEYAKENPITIMKLPVKPIGDNEKYRICLGDFRVVFSFEIQPTGKFKHLSVSLFPTKKGRLPSVEAVNELLKVFHFKNHQIRNSNYNENIHVWLEDEFQAINAIERVTEDEK